MAFVITEEGKKLLKQYASSWLFRLVMFKRLPSIYFWGVRIKELNAFSCDVTVPYKWTSQNPFKSIYFSALAGTAELSTGALVQVHLAGRGKYSMLVTHFEMDFVKKAKTLTTFTCSQGNLIAEAVANEELKGGGQQFTLKTEGKDEDGVVVAVAKIQWSIKKKELQ